MIPGFHSFDLIIILLTIIPFLGANIFWIWMLVDSVTNKRLEQDQRIPWVLVVIFTHIVGAVLYFFFGRPKALTPF
jgi:Phospholipase_D-nuclease N-terminal